MAAIRPTARVMSSSALSQFTFPNLPSSWFIGHMSRALREMRHLILSQSVSLIIETRDSRLPLTSINPAFEEILREASGGVKGAELTKRLIVYNKRDLGERGFEQALKSSLESFGGYEVMFSDSRSDDDIKKILEAVIRLANRPLESTEDRINVMIAGMPNVGKSSILNSLRRVGVRKGKAASVSSSPGHTRRLSTVIKISSAPPIYIYDTPGIMIPYLGGGLRGQETALKLALTGGIKESLFEEGLVGEYLVWRWRRRAELNEGVGEWSEAALLERLSLPPDTSLSHQPFLSALALRLSALIKGGEPDLDFASRYLVRAFREGKLGEWTLDNLAGGGGEVVDWDFENSPTTTSTTTAPTTPKTTEETILSYLHSQSLLKLTDISSNQQKKNLKASQANVREVKRKAREVVQVKVGAGTGRGVRGGGNVLSSGRRRVYRR